MCSYLGAAELKLRSKNKSLCLHCNCHILKIKSKRETFDLQHNQKYTPQHFEVLQKVVKIFFKLNRNKICFSWYKLTRKIASSRILTTLCGKYGNTGQNQQSRSQQLLGLYLCKEKLGRQGCQTIPRNKENTPHHTTDTHTHIHASSHTHTQEREGGGGGERERTHHKL